MARQRLAKEERKKQLKVAAIHLISEKGYRDTSVQDIVDAAEFSKGGFYNCYHSKKELFVDILKDSMEYRQQRVLEAKKNTTLNKKDFMIEALLDKMLDFNEYKKVNLAFMLEMVNNQELFDMYETMSFEFTQSFIEFCKKEGLEEYLPISNREFSIFIVSLMLGVEVFRVDDRAQYRDMLREMITAYADKKNLFGDQEKLTEDSG